MLSPFVRRKMALAFYRFDLSHNGLVSQEDFVQLAERVAAELKLDANAPQRKKIVKAFSAMWETYARPADKDGDNAITLDEYLDAHREFLKRPDARDLGIAANAATFDAIDLDGDGDIAEREYAAFLRPQGVSADDAHAAFRKLDLDGDGAISRQELATDWWEYWNSDDRSARGNWFYGPI